MDDLRERLALAAFVSRGDKPERWLEVHQCYRDDAYRAADSILAEIDAAGYAVVEVAQLREAAVLLKQGSQVLRRQASE